MKDWLWGIAFLGVLWTTVCASVGDFLGALIMGWVAWGALVVTLFFWTFDIRTRR